MKLVTTCKVCNLRAAKLSNGVCHECWQMDAGYRKPEGRGSLLEDMRYVRNMPAKDDKTEGHKDCREWKKKDPAGFLKTLMEMERTEAEKAQGPAEVEVDGGSARVIELCERLLKGTT